MAHNPTHRQNSGKKHSTSSTSSILSNPKPSNCHNPEKLIDSSNIEVWKSGNPNIRKQGKRVVSESVKSKCMVVVEDDKNKDNGRTSYSEAEDELSSFLVTNCAKLVSADMPPCMQLHAVSFARKIKDSLEKFTSKNLALSLKKEFDGVYGPAWHCIVGTSFGSFVTHSVAGFLYFSLDQKLYVLLFKTAVQRAD